MICNLYIYHISDIYIYIRVFWMLIELPSAMEGDCHVGRHRWQAVRNTQNSRSIRSDSSLKSRSSGGEMKVGSKARRFLVRTDSDMVGWLYFGEESWFDFSFVLYDFRSMLFFIFEFFFLCFDCMA